MYRIYFLIGLFLLIFTAYKPIRIKSSAFINDPIESKTKPASINTESDSIDDRWGNTIDWNNRTLFDETGNTGIFTEPEKEK